MTFEELFASWKEDSQLDPTNIGSEGTKTPKLHHKYATMLSQERMILRKLQADMKGLKLEKYEFYCNGPTQEQVALGWKLPPRGRILKQDVDMYLEADEQMIAMSLRVGMQQEKVDYLESIMKTIMTRGYLLKTILDYHRFQAGIG